MRALNCPECSRVVSSQGLPNHRRFVHGVPGAASAAPAETGQWIPWGTVALVVVAVAAVIAIVTYTVWRCPHCARLSIVKRDQAITTCPKCLAAMP